MNSSANRGGLGHCFRWRQKRAEMSLNVCRRGQDLIVLVISEDRSAPPAYAYETSRHGWSKGPDSFVVEDCAVKRQLSLPRGKGVVRPSGWSILTFTLSKVVMIFENRDVRGR